MGTPKATPKPRVTFEELYALRELLYDISDRAQLHDQYEFRLTLNDVYTPLGAAMRELALDEAVRKVNGG